MEATDHTYSKIQPKQNVKETLTVAFTEYANVIELSNTRQSSSVPESYNSTSSIEHEDSTTLPINDCDRAIASSNTRQSPSPTLSTSRIPEDEDTDSTAVPKNEIRSTRQSTSYPEAYNSTSSIEDEDSTIAPRNEWDRAVASSNTRQSSSPILSTSRFPVYEVGDATAVPLNDRDDVYQL